MAHLNDAEGYAYANGAGGPEHAYQLLAVEELLAELKPRLASPRLFDVGCGNGSVAAWIASLGWEVTGVDPSVAGIRQANLNHPEICLQQGSAYDDLAGRYGTFPVVLSLEVVEHVYDPRTYAACLYALLEEGGVAIVSTPYHGYVKNLMLAVTGRMDAHFTALWDYGHVKFWSMKTLAQLLRETGFREIEFRRVGRLACLAKSMIAIARKRNLPD